VGHPAAVIAADGRRFEAEKIVLAAGTYFSPAVLLRSGIGPEAELRRLGIPILQPLPVGERLLDHCGTDVAFALAAELQEETTAQADGPGVFEAHAVAKVASTRCESGTWDLHLLPWIYPAGSGGEFQASIIVFHMKPLSSGRIRLRSTDPADAPLVERGFLTRAEDLFPLLEGIELARSIASTSPLRGPARGRALAGSGKRRAVRAGNRSQLLPPGRDLSDWGRGGPRRGGHWRRRPVSADASIMPTIPRANTNLTTAAIAEKIAQTL
jgi:choline dehydrogenase